MGARITAAHCFALSGLVLLHSLTQGGAPQLSPLRLPWADLFSAFQAISTKSADALLSAADVFSSRQDNLSHQGQASSTSLVPERCWPTGLDCPARQFRHHC